MKSKSLLFFLCIAVIFCSFTIKEETNKISLKYNKSKIFINSLVQTNENLRLDINNPLTLGKYTLRRNNKRSLIESAPIGHFSSTSKIIFIPNKGQIIDTEGNLRPDILYEASMNGTDLFLTKKGMSFIFYEYENIHKNFAAGKKVKDKNTHPLIENQTNDIIVKMYRMDLNILGMNENFRVLNDEKTKEYFNYYYAHCSQGITNVHGYKKVVFKNVYNNIDVVYYSTAKGLKYDFIVKPGGKVSDIKLKYINEEVLYLTDEGKIKAINPFGELESGVLYTYQSNSKAIESCYKKNSDGVISIHTSEYDKTKELIIDPYIGATYYGGSNEDIGNSISTDGNNNILVTGSTTSLDFPSQNPGGGAYYQDTLGGSVYDRDAFILKFNSSGVRQWATYYGGGGEDYAFKITTDSNNNILVSGETRSTNFPLKNPGGGAYFQSTLAGWQDAFVLKFSSNGIIQWATYYGGNDKDFLQTIATDNNNNILLSGSTESTDFPVQDPGSGAYFKGVHAGGTLDAFVIKFNSNCIRQWATYYGGDGNDFARSITADNNNNILITGSAKSKDFPVQDPGGGAYFQGLPADPSNYDAFILKFTSSGIRQWATFYGGHGMYGWEWENDYGNTIISDGNNNILVTGYTNSFDFPLKDPGGGAYFQDSLCCVSGGWYDAFILKFTASGIRQWATFYGGSAADYGNSIITDENNNIFVTGMTMSFNFPVKNPGGGAYFQNLSKGDAEVFILKFTSNGIRKWATYYGGESLDYGQSIFTNENNIFVTGFTSSSLLFHLQNPGGGAYFQSTFAGVKDAFILGFDSSGVIININIVSTTIPDKYELHQNYPNPFNPKTNIHFSIPKREKVSLKIYDIMGREIAVCYDDYLNAGKYNVEFDGSDLSSGVYFYKLIANDPESSSGQAFVDVKKMVLLK